MKGYYPPFNRFTEKLITGCLKSDSNYLQLLNENAKKVGVPISAAGMLRRICQRLCATTSLDYVGEDFVEQEARGGRGLSGIAGIFEVTMNDPIHPPSSSGAAAMPNMPNKAEQQQEAIAYSHSNFHPTC